MIKLSNEAKIGITVLVAIGVMFIGFRVMRDVPLLRQSHNIYVKYPQVGGLNTGGQILINGLKVGTVQKMELTKYDSVVVTLGIDHEFFIPQNSVAYLQSVDILGQKAIVIEKGNSPKEIPHNGRIKGEYVESFVTSIKGQGEKIGSDLTTSVNRLNVILKKMSDVVSENNKAEIDNILSNVGSTSEEVLKIMEQNSGELNEALQHARKTMKNLEDISGDNKPRVDSTLAELETITKEINSLTSELRLTNDELTVMLEQINKGEGTMGKLLYDPSLYQNVDSLAIELKKTMKSFNENPKRFLKHMKMVELF